MSAIVRGAEVVAEAAASSGKAVGRYSWKGDPEGCGKRPQDFGHGS